MNKHFCVSFSTIVLIDSRLASHKVINSVFLGLFWGSGIFSFHCLSLCFCFFVYYVLFFSWVHIISVLLNLNLIIHNLFKYKIIWRTICKTVLIFTFLRSKSTQVSITYINRHTPMAFGWKLPSGRPSRSLSSLLMKHFSFCCPTLTFVFIVAQRRVKRGTGNTL